MNHIKLIPISEITPEMTALFNDILGPGRFARTAYRVREQATKPIFGFNVYNGDELAGTISITKVMIGGTKGACLIGPLLVAERHRGAQLGLKLIEEGIKMANSKGLELALLVGDESYYEKAGFSVVPPGHMEMPGPVSPSRLLMRGINQAGANKEDILNRFKGPIIAE